MAKNTKFKIRRLPTTGKIGKLHFEDRKNIKPHELDTVEKLLHFGYDIICKQESNVPYEHTADIVWKNEIWELKSITGDSRYTMRNNFRGAKKQSRNIVIDITKSNIQLSSAINHSREFIVRNRRILKIFVLDKENYCIIDRSAL